MRVSLRDDSSLIEKEKQKLKRGCGSISQAIFALLQKTSEKYHAKAQKRKVFSFGGFAKFAIQGFKKNVS